MSECQRCGIYRLHLLRILVAFERALTTARTMPELSSLTPTQQSALEKAGRMIKA